MKKLTKYALGALLSVGISYDANALTFELHKVFSGDQPSGSVLVDITDAGADSVNLKITSELGTEFLGELFLNLNPLYDPDDLSFGFLSKTGTFTNPGIETETDFFKADGDGKYDIKFSFFNPPTQRFNNSDSITYHVTGITGLNIYDFRYPSAPDGGHGPFVAAAHIQNVVGPEGSGWITVPDGGATVMLLGSALVGLGALRRRFA